MKNRTAWALALAAALLALGPMIFSSPPAQADTPPNVRKAIGNDQAVTADQDVFDSDVQMIDSSWPGSCWRVWILIDEGASGSVVNRVYSDGSVGALNGGTALTAGVEYGFVVGAISSTTWNLQFETTTTADHVIVQEMREGQ